MSAEVLTRHKLTVADYHRMAEAGILDADSRVELIHGEIIDMAPIGASHAATTTNLNKLLVLAVADRAVVWPQNPVLLDEHNEPQPDLALLKPRPDYQHRKPGPEDVLLIVEVADTTLGRDLSVKVPLYARAGIPEVWIVDVKGQRVLVYAEPSRSGSYVHERAQGRGALSPHLLPAVSVRIEDLFR
jgi:Uma2 family endonuclease